MGTALLSFDTRAAAKTTARSFNFGRGRLTIHADSSDTVGQFALVEFAGCSGCEPPLHVHRNEDEFFLVIEGQLRVKRGNYEFSLQAGESAFLPRNTPHTFKIVSAQARFLNCITPGGFEQFFRDVSQQGGPEGAAEGPEGMSLEELIRVSGQYACTLMP